METIELSERAEHGAYLSYLYNTLLTDAAALGGRGDIEFYGGRAAVRIEIPDAAAFAGRMRSALL